MSTFFSSCWPSLRVIFIVIGLKAPALLPVGRRSKAGEKGRSAIVFAQGPPPGAEARLNSLLGAALGLPAHGGIACADQGSSALVAAFGPQTGGLLTTARGPSSKSSRKEPTG